MRSELCRRRDRSAKEKGACRRLSLFRARCASQQILAKQLALRELERPARLGAAVLLALDHARVAGQEAALLENAAQVRLEIGPRLRQAVTYGARLPRQAATGHG